MCRSWSTSRSRSSSDLAVVCLCLTTPSASFCLSVAILLNARRFGAFCMRRLFIAPMSCPLYASSPLSFVSIVSIRAVSLA